MKDTIQKVRALVSMKSTLIEALRSDLQRACRIINRLEGENQELRQELNKQQQEWWMQQDTDNTWVRETLDRHDTGNTVGVLGTKDELLSTGPAGAVDVVDRVPKPSKVD